jgi:hypothetical protein
MMTDINSEDRMVQETFANHLRDAVDALDTPDEAKRRFEIIAREKLCASGVAHGAERPGLCGAPRHRLCVANN